MARSGRVGTDIDDQVAVQQLARTTHRERHAVRRLPCLHRVAGALDGGTRKGALDVDPKLEGELVCDIGLGCLMGGEWRVAVAGRNDGRHEHPQLVAVPPMQRCVANVDVGALTGGQIADVHGVEPRLRLLDHHGRMAGLDGLLVAVFGLALLHRDGEIALAPDLDHDLVEHRIARCRKCIEGLERCILFVVVGLCHLDLGEEIVDDHVHTDLAQRHRGAGRRLHE